MGCRNESKGRSSVPLSDESTIRLARVARFMYRDSIKSVKAPKSLINLELDREDTRIAHARWLTRQSAVCK